MSIGSLFVVYIFLICYFLFKNGYDEVKQKLVEQGVVIVAPSR